MRTIINGLAAAAVLIAVPALAETKPGTPAPTATASSEQVVKDKRYCIAQTFTGSRLPKKICKTRSQWMDDDGFDPLAQK